MAIKIKYVRQVIVKGKQYYQYRRKLKYTNKLFIRNLPSPISIDFSVKYNNADIEYDKLANGKKYFKNTPRLLENIIKDYESSDNFLNLSKPTQSTYKRLNRRIINLYGDVDITTIIESDLRNALKYIKETKSVGSANNLLKQLKVIFKYVIENTNYLNSNPTQNIKMFAYKKKSFHCWTDTERKIFVKKWKFGTTEYLFYSLLFYTSQRINDIRLLKWENVFLDEKYIYFEPSKTIKKTSLTLKIPISNKLLEVLKATPQKNEYVVVTSYNKHFTSKGASNFIKKACEKAGLSHCSAHGLRHSLATYLINKGASKIEIMAFTGHNNSKMVDTYIKKRDLFSLAIKNVDLLNNEE